MALATDQARVSAGERERAGVVIEQHLAAPAPFIVTALTSGSLLMIVHVVIAVARVTGGRLPLGAWLGAVAIRARCLLVAATQREMCVAIVVEGRSAPVDGCVTRLAGVAEMPLMPVVAGVAADAGGRGVVRRRAGFVAADTGGCRVPTDQGEGCLARVVEDGAGPTARRVARQAVAAEGSLVAVVLRMTGNAFCGRRLEAPTRMAALAAQRLMSIPQGEASCAVVELCRLPAALVVATRAGHTECAVVRILCLVVAVATRRGGVAKAGVGGMATFTVELGVTSDERHVGEAMIKGAAFEMDQGRVAALVFSVAGFALLRLDCRLVPVEAAAGIEIAGDVRMARQAETVLRRLFERLMAFAARLLRRRMLLCDLSRHN